MNQMKHLLPVDGYYVLMDQQIVSEHSQSLTHLYQPLIGMQAVMLYETLLNDLPLQNKASLQTHHTLMNYLDIPLNEIYDARLKLEAIGLLKTYENKQEQQRYFIYELISPLSPNEFFDHVILSELLHHHIGRSKYRTLQDYFGRHQVYQKGKEITVSFQDVFQTFTPTAEESIQMTKEDEARESIVPTVDFEWLELSLSRQMIQADKVLTNKNKAVISEIMFLYDLPSHEIEKAILWSLTDEHVLNVAEFQTACHDLYQLKENKQPIKLTTKQQHLNNAQADKQVEKLTTKEEKLLHRFESISPRQLLQDFSSGGHASSRELQMVSDIMAKQGLPAPVMNVLIHYVLIQSNMKLSKAYLETIASHWSRAKLTTAREAMDFAKKEINKRQQNQRFKPYQSRQKSQEVIPDWFKERKANKQAGEKQESDTNTDQDYEAQRQELADLIKQFANEE